MFFGSGLVGLFWTLRSPSPSNDFERIAHLVEPVEYRNVEKGTDDGAEKALNNYRLLHDPLGPLSTLAVCFYLKRLPRPSRLSCDIISDFQINLCLRPYYVGLELSFGRRLGLGLRNTFIKAFQS